MAYFRVLTTEAGVYTKDGQFFEDQGGLTADWGNAWEGIEARDLTEARQIGIVLRRKRYPNSHRTIGEDEVPPEIEALLRLDSAEEILWAVSRPPAKGASEPDQPQAALTEASPPPSHFNGLSPAEDERLALLVEEMAEAQQAICKILRHGYESHNPHASWDNDRSNREALEEELGHVAAALQLLLDSGDVRHSQIVRSEKSKLISVAAWLHHQDIQGTATGRIEAKRGGSDG